MHALFVDDLALTLSEGSLVLNPDKWEKKGIKFNFNGLEQKASIEAKLGSEVSYRLLGTNFPTELTGKGLLERDNDGYEYQIVFSE